VGAFVLGMLLTPPDIISQSMLAIPMLLLFEVGVIIASIYYKEDEELEKDES
jgi:sec-independent protein translocase protein TatC